MIPRRICRSIQHFTRHLETLFASIPMPVWAVLAVICAGTLLYVGGRPGSDLPLPRRLPPGTDKLLHFTGFAGMAACVFRAVYPPDPLARPLIPAAGAIVILVPFLVGMADEIHQAFVPGRSSDPIDLLADTMGGVIVLLVGLAIRSRFRRRYQRRSQAARI